MSNSASISAAKKRRGGGPPLMGGGPGQGQGMSLPPGLPPNFRQLPPQVQQQLFQQLQQRAAAAAAASKLAPPPTPPQGQHSMPPPPQQTRIPTPGQGNNTINVPGPYTVNPVIHNRAVAEVDGIHIRDLPISSSGLPCLPSGAALPPNVLFKLHHDELLNMDAILNEHSNKIQMMSNRIDKGMSLVSGSTSNGNTGSDNGGKMSDRNEVSYDSLVNNTSFITKILDNILTNTNLSDIINQIEPLQKENESLRSLLNSQQTTLNELSGLVMKLIASGMPSYSSEGVGTSSIECDGGGGGGGGGDDDKEYSYNNYENTNSIESSVYNPNDTQYMDQNNSGSNYMSNNVDGVDGVGGIDGVCSLSIGNLEEVVEDGRD
jgi:hypothetical protein